MAALLHETNAAMTAAFPQAGRLAQPTLVRRVWRGAVEVSRAFFFASEGQQSNDHLVEVVRRDPARACRIIRSVSLFSTIGNLVVGMSCAIFLLLYWSRCGDACDRPLRWWILAQSGLQLCQLPVRLVLYLCVRDAEAVEGGRVEADVSSLTASPAWRASKVVALVQYGWFVLGMVWYTHTESCPSCPGAARLTGAVMVLSAAKAGVALLVFRLLFAPGGGADGGEAKPRVVAASAAQIAALPVLRFSRGSRADDANCAVCLIEFSEGVFVRTLPCGHDFHRRCIDKWLQRNKRCPLCINAIDEPCTGFRVRGKGE